MKRKHLSIILIVLSAFFIALMYWDSQQQLANANLKNQILLRKIGDEVLKRSNDSNSKVLPIEMISDNEFHIQFENKISIKPDILVSIIKRNLNQSTFSKEYAV